MKTQRYKVILMGCALLLFISQLYWGASPGYAQNPEPAVSPPAAAITPAAVPLAQATAIPLEQSPPGVAEVTFAQLNQPTFELRSPIDQQSFTFEVPYRWALAEGGGDYIELHYDMQYAAHDPANQPGAVNVAITVYFNDTLITSFIPVEGTNQTLRIPVPPEALNEPDENRYQLRFLHLSGDCDDYFERSQFVIHDHSFVHFDYEMLPLQINLADFPRPLVQDLFGTEEIVLVIPDEYSDADLSAAASVAAPLGHRTFNSPMLDIITASQATAERLANTSAIIIGQPEANTFLLDLYQRNLLPTSLTADGSLIASSATQPISPEDGVLQEIVSSFNPDHVYLIVTGSSEVALTNAARALSVLAPRYGFDGNLVVISEFHELSAKADSTDTFTLADFDFRDTTLYGLDTRSASVRFFVPASWRLTKNPTLTLSYFHSGVVQPSSSGLTVNLNGQPVGSAPIDATTLGQREAVIELPLADIRPGARNRLNFEANLNVQAPGCTLPELDSAWIRISETSELQLPHTEAEAEGMAASLDDPLTPFAARQDLSDVWLSLPQNPMPEELRGMVQVAAWLGNFGDGPGFAPRVSRGPVDEMAALEPYHVIAFGRPTSNPLIALVNEALPQPFMPDEDNLRQQVGNVVYHLPDQYSLGLLQALPAPWNPEQKVMLAVTGTTPEGVQWAMDTLTNEETYYQLSGDLAFIRAERIESFDSAKFIRGPLAAAIEEVADEGEEVALKAAAATPTATAVAVALVPDKPASQKPVPDNYLPQSPPSSTMVRWLTLGLIGMGLVIVAVGSALSQRKAKTR